VDVASYKRTLGFPTNEVSFPTTSTGATSTLELLGPDQPGKGESQDSQGSVAQEIVTGPDLLSYTQKPAEKPAISLETHGSNFTSDSFHTTYDTAQLLADKLEQAGLPDYARKIRECHTKWVALRCQQCGRRYAIPNHCDLRFCPHCQRRISKQRQKELEWWIRLLDRPKHVVLTVRNTQKLTKEYIQWVKKCFSRLRRRKFARTWRSGIYAIEVTNESRGWHVHIHALIEAVWIDQRELAKTWAEIVGQDYAIVWVGAAKDAGVAKEVMKYTVKGNQLASWSPEEIRQYILATEGIRLFGRFGELNGEIARWKQEIEEACDTGFTCVCGSSDFDRIDNLDYETCIRIVRGPPESWDQYLNDQLIDEVAELAATF